MSGYCLKCGALRLLNMSGVCEDGCRSTRPQVEMLTTLTGRCAACKSVTWSGLSHSCTIRPEITRG